MHCLEYSDRLFEIVLQNSIKICGIQEAARNKQEQHITKRIKTFISESYSSSLLVVFSALVGIKSWRGECLVSDNPPETPKKSWSDPNQSGAWKIILLLGVFPRLLPRGTAFNQYIGDLTTERGKYHVVAAQTVASNRASAVSCRKPSTPERPVTPSESARTS